MVDSNAVASGLSPVTEDRTRRPVRCPAIGWLPRPIEDAAPGFVGLLFMAAGLFVWLLFWYGVDEPPQGLARWGPVGFTALFFSAGVFLARMGFRAPRWWADRRFRGGREPWGQGYRWSRLLRPLPPQRGLGLVERAIGLVMVLALLVVSNLVWADLRSVTGDAWVVYLVIPVVSVAMLATVALGAWGIVVQLRQGRGTLHIDAGSYPARPGTTFRAVYERGPRQPPLAGAAATLSCIEIDRGSGGRRPAASAVYTQTREFDAGRVADDGGSRATLEFSLPPDVSPADLAREEGRRCWLLEIAGSDARGISVAEPETFLVPVS